MKNKLYNKDIAFIMYAGNTKNLYADTFIYKNFKFLLLPFPESPSFQN